MDSKVETGGINKYFQIILILIIKKSQKYFWKSEIKKSSLVGWIINCNNNHNYIPIDHIQMHAVFDYYNLMYI